MTDRNKFKLAWLIAVAVLFVFAVIANAQISDESYLNACIAKYNVGNCDGAITICSIAKIYYPQSPEPYFITGSCLFMQGKHKEAKEDLNKYLQIVGPNGTYIKQTKTMLDTIDSNK
jgi:tetratricopeptide (TPR) repeat protein